MNNNILFDQMPISVHSKQYLIPNEINASFEGIDCVIIQKTASICRCHTYCPGQIRCPDLRTGIKHTDTVDFPAKIVGNCSFGFDCEGESFCIDQGLGKTHVSYHF